MRRDGFCCIVVCFCYCECHGYCTCMSPRVLCVFCSLVTPATTIASRSQSGHGCNSNWRGTVLAWPPSPEAGQRLAPVKAGHCRWAAVPAGAGAWRTGSQWPWLRRRLRVGVLARLRLRPALNASPDLGTGPRLAPTPRSPGRASSAAWVRARVGAGQRLASERQSPGRASPAARMRAQLATAKGCNA